MSLSRVERLAILSYGYRSSLGEIVSALGAEKSEFRSDIRSSMADEAEAFHRRAGALTDSVASSLVRLRQDSLVIRIAHQANFLFSLSVLDLIHSLQVMSWKLRKVTRTPFVPVFLVVDFDDASDARFRSTYMPTLRSMGSRLTLAVRVERGALMYQSPPPSSRDIDTLLRQARHAVLNDLAALRRVGLRTHKHLLDQRVEMVRGYMHDSASVASDLADFNALFMAKIVNRVFGYSILFMNLRRLRPIVAPEMAALWKNRQVVQRALAVSLNRLEERLGIPAARLVQYRPDGWFWIICTSCSHRCRLLGRDSECPSCGRDLGPISDAADFEASVRDGLIQPGVLMDDLLDRYGLGVLGGVQYLGSIGHHVVARELAGQLGLPSTMDYFPVEPVLQFRGLMTAARRFCRRFLDGPQTICTWVLSRDATGQIVACCDQI
jgi:hypothetical protein